jgi:hypothetical protein
VLCFSRKFATIISWICRSVKNCRTWFRNGWPKAVRFSSPSNARRLEKINCQAGVGDRLLAAMAHNHDKLVWHCRLCLLMPDHLHTILAFPREPGMQTVISNWKKFVAVQLGVK